MLWQPAPRLATRVFTLRSLQSNSTVLAHSQYCCRFFSSGSSSSGTPWVRHAGECAFLLRFGTEIDMEVNKKMLAYLAVLDKMPPLDGLIELLPTYASLFVKFDPLKVSRSQVEQWCLSASAGASGADKAVAEPRLVSIPVRYGGEYGPDVEEAAQIAGLSSPEEVVRVHSNGDYRVYFLGFMGGFPYMGGLPAVLAKVPRLQTPRQKVPKGTVGIAGGQTGVYTITTPGGWYMLGRTSANLFDPSKDPPSLLRAGDLVKFIPSEEEILDTTGTQNKSLPPPENPWIQILSPGPLVTVQDFGRNGYARYGVSYSGAADKLALRMGNALLGNEAGAAGLEVMMGGLKFRCLDSCAIALTGADCEAKLKRPSESRSQPLRLNEVLLLHRDDEVELSFPKDGMRTYVCVQGGVDVPVVLGSRATDIRGGLGGLQGRSLERDDTLGMLLSGAKTKQLSPLRAVHDPLRAGSAPGGKTWRLRVLPGPGDPRTGEVFVKELEALLDASFNVTGRADRMAVCVAQEGKDEANAAAKKAERYRDIPYGISEYVPPELIMGKYMNLGSLVGGQQMSEGSVSGTVQLPPDGNPVILLAEHQTTGGYKVPAVVIQADLWQVGQMKPGDRLCFVETTPEEAVAALRELHACAQETAALA